jgi:hypothetical protein
MHDGVSHYREASHNSTLTNRNQHVTILSELLEGMDIFFIAASTLNQAYVAALSEFLEIVQRRFVKLNEFQQVEDPFVNIEERHVAAETSCQ